MKELYTSLATKYNIDWNGRISQNWENADTINKNLTSINQLLYCICHAVINNLGYSTVFGFIHTGKYNSFVYDIADLYKEEFVLPLVFEKTSLNCSITEIRTAFRTLVVEKQLLKRMVNDLKTIFGDTSNYDGSGYLWDTTENVKAGYNFFNESI